MLRWKRRNISERKGNLKKTNLHHPVIFVVDCLCLQDLGYRVHCSRMCLLALWRQLKGGYFCCSFAKVSISLIWLHSYVVVQLMKSFSLRSAWPLLINITLQWKMALQTCVKDKTEECLKCQHVSKMVSLFTFELANQTTTEGQGCILQNRIR